MPEPSDLSDTLVTYTAEVFYGRITSVERVGNDLKVGAYNMGHGRHAAGTGDIIFEDAGEIESVNNRVPEAACYLCRGMIITDLEYVAGTAWLKVDTKSGNDLNPSTHSIRCRNVQVQRTGLRAALRRLFAGDAARGSATT